MPQQVSDPLAVAYVGLAARHGFDVLGVGQNKGEGVLQQVIDRLPVDAGAFHGDVGTAASASQWRSPSNVAVCVLKLRTVFCTAPVGLGVTKQATTVCLWMSSPQQRSYRTSTFVLPDGCGAEVRRRQGCYACCPKAQQMVVLPDPQVKVISGREAPYSKRPKQPRPVRTQHSDHRRRFMRGGAAHSMER